MLNGEACSALEEAGRDEVWSKGRCSAGIEARTLRRGGEHPDFLGLRCDGMPGADEHEA